jgi:hypothetical protein
MADRCVTGGMAATVLPFIRLVWMAWMTVEKCRRAASVRGMTGKELYSNYPLNPTLFGRSLPLRLEWRGLKGKSKIVCARLLE